ncbi:hypothetical protein KIJ05_04965 [Leuconostoc gelidum subsp. gasicomitatum]|nr:hypothetical protein [Leuconostoc gasicomitatum]
MNRLVDANVLERINHKKLERDQINSIVGLSFSKLLLQQHCHIPISKMSIFNDSNNDSIPISFFEIFHYNIYLAICNGTTRVNQIPEMIDGHNFIKNSGRSV